jgi:tRNA nucleotidyltransferase/poly(A) polymerase
MTTLPPGSAKIMRTLRAAGFEAYLVGGSVRDLLLERRGGDADFTTSARPADLQRLFPGSHYENRFGTVLVRAAGRYHEVTTYRGEGRYSDHRHPDEIRFVDTLDEDLQRRDFTINAMALDESKELTDPYGGRADLEARIIRAVGDAGERLAEDPLRMMRAVRLAVQLDFAIELQTADAIRRDAGLLSMISRERIRDELLKILDSGKPADGVELLAQLELLPNVLPSLAMLRSSGDRAYDHAIETLRNCAEGALLRLAALLHALAEATPARFLSPAHSFDAEIERLRLSNEAAGAVHRLVDALALVRADQPADDRRARWLLSRLGEALDDVIRLGEAHSRASRDQAVEGSPSLAWLRDLRRAAGRVRRIGQAYTLAGLAVNGDDLIRELDIPPGRKLGTTLRLLLDRVLDDPSLNDRKTLLGVARRELLGS